PFHPDELAARVRAVLRRSSGAAPGSGILTFDDIEIDLERRMVTRNGELVQLSRTEWLLLQHLAANAGKVVLHTELLTKVWGPEYRDDVQNDFADPAGSLAVAGADAIIGHVNREIAQATAAGALVVLTQDWHPAVTPHFEKDGGIWPVHCLAESWGAALHPDLVAPDDA